MLLYLLQVTLCWGLFALLYAFILRKETFFRANRIYLLATAAAGLLLPLSGDWFPLPQNEGESLFVALPDVNAGFREMEAAVATWSWNEALIWIYGIGFSLALARLLRGLSRLAGLIIRNRTEHLPDGTVIVCAGEARLPFSFFHWIFVPNEIENQPDFREMLVHERAHVHGRHSIDVMLMEFLCVALWFHPLAHWFRKSLRNVHEYLADAVATRETNRRQYGRLLLRQAQVVMPVALAHHFLQSPLRQRIAMLTKESSAPACAWKYALAMPLVALFLFAFRQAPVPNPAPEYTADTFDGVYKTCDKLPEFPGGMPSLVYFMQDNLTYPEADQRAGRSGLVGVTFVVNTSGEVENIRTAALNGSPSPAMHAEARRIIEQMPRWQPAEHRGQKVKCQFMLPVRFALQ